MMSGLGGTASACAAVASGALTAAADLRRSGRGEPSQRAGASGAGRKRWRGGEPACLAALIWGRDRIPVSESGEGGSGAEQASVAAQAHIAMRKRVVTVG